MNATDLEALTQDLAETCQRYDLSVPPEQLSQLARYCQLLWRYNEQLNLTRHTTVELFVTRDLVDCLHLSAAIGSGEEVLDMGTGGGVPGVVLAILRPDLEIALSESVAKKARVVDQIVQELELPVPVYHERAEEILQEMPCDCVVARAVGPLSKLCRWLKPCWGRFGYLLAVKGPRWVEERGEARHLGLLQGWELRRKVDEYRSPGDDPHYSAILRIAAARGNSEAEVD